VIEGQGSQQWLIEERISAISGASGGVASKAASSL